MFGINRGATKLCNSSTIDQWCCQTDLCNNGVKMVSTNFIYLIVVLFFLSEKI
jgi:hypothetical protein